jgi:ribosome-associated protein
MITITHEISFNTFRSGGKGGQNVNKVETAVEGCWLVAASAFFSEEEKQLLFIKLANKINAKGFLQVRSQTYRTQLQNKEEVIKKIQALIATALTPKKARITTRPSKASKEKRIQQKKKNSERKMDRKKSWFNNP